MKLFPIFLIILVSCQPTGQLYDVQGENLIISDTSRFDAKLNQLVLPYRQKMEDEMNTIIGQAVSTLKNSKTDRESDLGNWMADVIFETGINYLQSNNTEIKNEHCFSLINKGGIRAPINSGPITVGNIYEVMPFNNEIVVVTLEPIKVKEILEYLYIQNGQPVSNVIIELSEKMKSISINSKEYTFESPIFIITSDYLAKGGDNMDFFDNPISISQTGTLFRDAILEKVQHEKKIAAPANTNRIQFMESYE
ncbi:MAG: 5'-nucleotidase C-terminal domain-containing protein [Crocinitomicaceae bacterium]